MNKYILIFLCLFKLSLFTGTFLYYRPMSKKSIDFGEEVCYYEDISDDSKLKYVKGCPSGKHCLPVLADNSEYNVHTCQPYFSDLKRKSGEDCDANLYECFNDISCTNGKCSSGSGGSGTSPTCTTIGKKINTGTETCITDQTQISSIGDVCETKDSFSSTETIYYTHYSTSGSCKKLEIKRVEGETQEKYYIKSKELVKGYFSLQDGDYFEDPIDKLYCENGFYLYFFGNGKEKLDTTGEQMYKRCVKVLAIEEITAGSSYVIKYKINNEEHIYDTSKLDGTFKTNQNTECSASFLMTRLELFQKMKEEYKKNPSSNEYTKWSYLYGHPEEYLLYKDQIDVLDYLIQSSNGNYIPEALTPNANVDNIQTTTTTSDGAETNGTEAPTEPSNQSSGFLNIHYFIILLSLFIL